MILAIACMTMIFSACATTENTFPSSEDALSSKNSSISQSSEEPPPPQPIEEPSSSISEPISSSSTQSTPEIRSIPISESKYFTDIMPPLTPEEEAIVNQAVSKEYLYDFENYICFPHDPLENGLTYGELWRYIGDNHEITIYRDTIDGEISSDYPRILPQLKSIRKLIGNTGDEHFPLEDIFKMTWLKEITLEGDGYPIGGGLTEFPEGIKALTELTYLSMSLQDFESSNLRMYPDIFDSFEKLEYLDLSFNPGVQIPPSVFRLRNLKELNLSYCKLTSLPKGIEQLNNLRVLNLCANPLSEIPDEICELTNLQELHLCGIVYSFYPTDWPSPKANKLPERIGDLTNLRYLVISSFPICRLPESIGELKDLDDLIIDLPLEELPNSWSDLYTVKNVNIYFYVPWGSYNEELENQAKDILKMRREIESGDKHELP